MSGGFLARLARPGPPPAGADAAAMSRPSLRPVLRDTSPVFEHDAALWSDLGVARQGDEPAPEASPMIPAIPSPADGGAPPPGAPAPLPAGRAERTTSSPPAQPFPGAAAALDGARAAPPADRVPPAQRRHADDGNRDPAPQTGWPSPRKGATSGRITPPERAAPAPGAPGRQPSAETPPPRSSMPREAVSPAGPPAAGAAPERVRAAAVPPIRPAGAPRRTIRAGAGTPLRLIPDEEGREAGLAPVPVDDAAAAPAPRRPGPAVAPRIADAALALPLPEGDPSASAAGPRVEIGRVIVEVVRDPSQPEARPVETPPRTAEQASRIGPIGDLRTGLRRFGWSGRRGG